MCKGVSSTTIKEGKLIEKRRKVEGMPSDPFEEVEGGCVNYTRSGRGGRRGGASAQLTLLEDRGAGAASATSTLIEGWCSGSSSDAEAG